jgi:hypothetical protein
MDAGTWAARFAAELGLDAPSEDHVKTLLSLASVAANASERWAAPISCWLVAVAGVSPEEGLALARRLAAPSTGGPGAGAAG